MKEITLFVEGGVQEGDNTDVQTIDNTQALRESFHQIFKDLGINNVSLKVEMSAGYKNCLKRFLEKDCDNKFILIDLDAPAENRELFFEGLRKEETIDSEKINEGKDQIFFMIQSMEGWILSQPNAIEAWANNNGYKRIKVDKIIAEDNNIKDKHPQNIQHPASVLKTILGRYFETNKGKKAKYGKLRSAPQLLNKLDRTKLKSDFSDVENLVNRLNI